MRSDEKYCFQDSSRTTFFIYTIDGWSFTHLIGSHTGSVLGMPSTVLDNKTIPIQCVAPNDTAYKWWSCHIGHKQLCKLCRTFPPPSMGVRFTVFGQAGHADPLDGWHCSSQKRVMSRLIQVRQHYTNESGFVISAINKYMLGSRYP